MVTYPGKQIHHFSVESSTMVFLTIQTSNRGDPNKEIKLGSSIFFGVIRDNEWPSRIACSQNGKIIQLGVLLTPEDVIHAS